MKKLLLLPFVFLLLAPFAHASGHTYDCSADMWTGTLDIDGCEGSNFAVDGNLQGVWDNGTPPIYQTVVGHLYELTGTLTGMAADVGINADDSGSQTVGHGSFDFTVTADSTNVGGAFVNTNGLSGETGTLSNFTITDVTPPPPVPSGIAAGTAATLATTTTTSLAIAFLAILAAIIGVGIGLLIFRWGWKKVRSVAGEPSYMKSYKNVNFDGVQKAIYRHYSD